MPQTENWLACTGSKHQLRNQLLLLVYGLMDVWLLLFQFAVLLHSGASYAETCPTVPCSRQSPELRHPDVLWGPLEGDSILFGVLKGVPLLS